MTRSTACLAANSSAEAAMQSRKNTTLLNVSRQKYRDIRNMNMPALSTNPAYNR